jgi:major membrane immunogen (membrane-anchored lipoprotein)
MKKLFPLMVLLLSLMAQGGCSPDKDSMHNGYYSAVAASFNEGGWKEFITLYVYNNRIVTVEYNARNASGLILSWDVLSLRKLKARTRVHPNLLLRGYTQELLNKQEPSKIRRISGDEYFYDSFTELAAAAIAQAKTGNKDVVEVPLPEGRSAFK